MTAWLIYERKYAELPRKIWRKQLILAYKKRRQEFDGSATNLCILNYFHYSYMDWVQLVRLGGFRT